ncbi:MAG: hypothetical protein Q9203_005906 [Teloschistes exilis]
MSSSMPCQSAQRSPVLSGDHLLIILQGAAQTGRSSIQFATESADGFLIPFHLFGLPKGYHLDTPELYEEAVARTLDRAMVDEHGRTGAAFTKSILS